MKTVFNSDAVKQETGCCGSCCSKVNVESNQDDKKKFFVRLILNGVLFIAGLLLEYGVLKNIFFINEKITAALAVCIAAYLLAGFEVLRNVVKNIAKGDFFDENFLMTIATFGAFAIGEYPEAVAVMLFYQIGEAFEGAAVKKSRSSIAQLMDIRPDYADLKVGEDIRRVSPFDVNIGQLIVVRPGEKIPLDGVIVEGVSSLDTKALTGESLPRDVEPGCEALSGSINKNGLLTIRVTKAAGESTAAKILELVQNAGEKKSRVENFITRFARIYTPVIVVCAVLLAVIPPIFVRGAVFSDWLNRALVFLVVSCPCALVVSVPLSFFGGIGRASKQGVLIKGSNYLETLANIDTIVFDKTGTLTKGIFKIKEITALGEMTKEEILFYAAHAENFSNHPAAVCITSSYTNTIDKNAITNLEEIAGCGIKVFINQKKVLAGNKKLLLREGILLDTVPDDTAGDSGVTVYIAVENRLEGYITISDEIKNCAAAALLSLKKLGIKKTIMLSGDTEKEAASVASQIGIDSYFANLLPHQKVEQIERIISGSVNGVTAFVGDGINDAPVLARVDVGIAMGALGSDAAIEAADVVLMNDDLFSICTAIKISRKTKTIVNENIILALGVKALILVLGAAGLVSIWLAVFGDVGVLFLAVLNAMRTMRNK